MPDVTPKTESGRALEEVFGNAKWIRAIEQEAASKAVAEVLDRETLREVIHRQYDMTDFVCRHQNQHRKSWDCWQRVEEIFDLAALIASERTP